MIPMCSLQNGIIPKLLTKHFFKEGYHGSQGVSHPVVCLLESYYKDMHKLRGGVTKKKRENLGQIPKGGGGLKKTDENSQFQFGNCENPGGGSRFFKNV